MADKTDGTVVGEVARLEPHPRRIAPTTGGQRSTLRNRLKVVACWRLNDHMFAFGSSFVSPDLAEEMPALGTLLGKYFDSPASIFGHADPVGEDDANQVLSARRAQAIFALLTRNIDIWENLFSKPVKQDDWGNRSIQLMLATVQHAPEEGDVPDDGDGLGQASASAAALGQTVPYYSGPITSTRTDQTVRSIKRFQRDHSLVVDGDPGVKTRQVLFQKYMDTVCANENGVAFSMDVSQFVGKGKGANGHGDFQACGELNPVLLFSRDEARRFDAASDKSQRNAENAINRRVMLFFFDPAVPIVESEWPCPNIQQGTAPCKKLFWPDGDKRRSPGDTRRKFAQGGDTFACRLYDSLARRSPCEGVSQQVIVLRLFDDQLDPQPIFDAQYRVKLPGGTRIGTATDAFVRIVVNNPPDAVDLEWSLPDDPPLTLDAGTPRFQLRVNLVNDSGDAQADATRRLHNLGFPESDGLAANLTAFQRTYGLPQTGVLDDATKTRIKEVHDSGEPDPDVTPKGAA